MADFIPILAQQSRLSQIPITQGQLIFVFDAGTVYVDYANQRHLMAGGSSSGGLNRVIVSQSQSAQPGNWYICIQPVTITLPSVHNQLDLVKVSTAIGVDAVPVVPSAGETIESDSGFLLDVDLVGAQFVWDTDKWRVAQLTSRSDNS